MKSPITVKRKCFFRHLPKRIKSYLATVVEIRSLIEPINHIDMHAVVRCNSDAVHAYDIRDILNSATGGRIRTGLDRARTLTETAYHAKENSRELNRTLLEIIEVATDLERAFAETKQWRYACKVIAEQADDMKQAWLDEFTPNRVHLFRYKALKALFELARWYPKTAAFATRLRRRTQEIYELINGQSPPGGPVDTLYHASVAARSLYDEGAMTDVPQVSLTSLTDSQGAAAATARVLLETTYIARGDWKLDDVVRLARHDGVGDQLDAYLDEMYEASIQRNGSERLAVMEAYKYYLDLAEWAGTRRNLIIGGDPADLVMLFEKVDPANVGYLTCTVGMQDELSFVDFTPAADLMEA